MQALNVAPSLVPWQSAPVWQKPDPETVTFPQFRLGTHFSPLIQIAAEIGLPVHSLPTAPPTPTASTANSTVRTAWERIAGPPSSVPAYRYRPPPWRAHHRTLTFSRISNECEPPTGASADSISPPRKCGSLTRSRTRVPEACSPAGMTDWLSSTEKHSQLVWNGPTVTATGVSFSTPKANETRSPPWTSPMS